jgi:hypothetical protein
MKAGIPQDKTALDRVGQNVVHDIVGRQSPDDAAGLAFARFHWQLDPFVAQEANIDSPSITSPLLKTREQSG